jgi:hypothetical protein
MRRFSHQQEACGHCWPLRQKVRRILIQPNFTDELLWIILTVTYPNQSLILNTSA